MDIFTQYEQESQKNRTNHPTNSPEMVKTIKKMLNCLTFFVFQNLTGFIQVKFEPEQPIFNKIQMNFTPLDKITHVAVSNNYLILAMANNVLFRIDIQQPDKHDGIKHLTNCKSQRPSDLRHFIPLSKFHTLELYLSVLSTTS